MFHVLRAYVFLLSDSEAEKYFNIILAAEAAALLLVVVVVVVLNLLSAFKKIAKGVYQLRHVCASVRFEQLPLNGFPYLILEDFFSKFSRENSIFIKILQE
jgi:hypothetical protein